MEQKEILEKLKSTELKIHNDIQEAQQKRNEILTQARKQAIKLEEDYEKRMKGEREKMLHDASQEIQTRRIAALKKATADAEVMKKKVQVKKAKEYFIIQFKEFVHV